jgi:hypothetical protein
MTERHLVPFSEEVLYQVLDILQEDAVLVGGQALAVWVSFFGIPLPGASPHTSNATFSVGATVHASGVAISADSDFMGDRELVGRLSQRLAHSSARYQLRSALSALHGVVEVHLDAHTYMSIDIIQGVAGLEGSRVWDRSITLVTPRDKAFRILHPLDVLASRVYNIAHFPEKQTANGALQVDLALRVANQYIRQTAIALGEKTALKQIEEVVSLAKSSEGRAARHFGADYRLALPTDAIDNGNFHQLRWPRIVEELDAAKPPAYLSRSAAVGNEGNPASGPPP